MRLRDVTMDDLPMYERLLTDPAMMSELGGPLPREVLSGKLAAIVENVRRGAVWYSVIVVDPDEAAGSVCIWDHEWEGGSITEIGWMVLPEFQGRGFATAAVLAILDRARAEHRWTAIHAFPGVTNGASNAICRKTGFAKLEERDVDGEGEFAGRTLRCNHWRLDLARPGG